MWTEIIYFFSKLDGFKLLTFLSQESSERFSTFSKDVGKTLLRKTQPYTIHSQQHSPVVSSNEYGIILENSHCFTFPVARHVFVL